MMFSNRTMAALFTIAIATSLVVVSGGGGIVVVSAFAKKAKQDESGTVPTVSSSLGKDTSSMAAVLRPDSSRSDAHKTPSADAGDSSSGTTGDTNGVSAKDLKSLSKCQAVAAADGDLTLSELKDCYTKAFNQGQDKPEDLNSAQGNDQPENGSELKKSSSLPEPKPTSIREGFNF